MKKLLIMAFAASAFAACCNNGGAACDARNLDRAKATLDSIYAHYGVAENRLLRENYPFNVDYTASYLASADQARPNPAACGASCSPESSDSAACGASCLPEPSEPALFCAPCSPQSSSAACEPTPAPASPASELEKPLSMWGALKGSLVIVAFFVAGCVAGLFALVPFDVAGARVSTYVLYALMFCVGVTLGHDETLAGRVRRLDPRLALLPVMTAVGTLAGAALATPLLPPLAVTDTLAVGSGFGYYSLSSIFIADFRGAELGTVALLCNVMREIFTLLAAPLVARWCGPLAAVSIGGATTFDTTLPVITQAAGKPYAVVSIFHGCTLDFSVPFLVTFFCTL